MAVADRFPIKGFDYIELLVGNAKQACSYYRALGFTPIAYAGLETGIRDRTSWCLAAGPVRLFVTSSLIQDSPAARHVLLHGDGVRDVGLHVPDAVSAYDMALQRGATSARAPVVHETEGGRVATASIVAVADTLHTFVSREGDVNALFRGFRPLPNNGQPNLTLDIDAIDHIALAVQAGTLDKQVAFYRDVMGFEDLHLSDVGAVTGEYSTMMSKVVEGADGKIRFPIMEPAQGRRKSQIDEFVDYYGSAGVQHVALHTPDIISTVYMLRKNGMEFLDISPTYSETAALRVPQIAEKVDELRRHSILVDKDEEGYLLQTFTHHVQDRPTFFFELIERHGSRGFGSGNVTGLFEAMERAQAVRGNL